MAGRLFEAARRRRETGDGPRPVAVEPARANENADPVPDLDDYGFGGLDGDAMDAEARTVHRVAPAAVDEATRAAQRDAYVDYAMLIVPMFAGTLEDLRQWWLDESEARKGYGVVAGTRAYDRLVLACELRKTDLQPSVFTR